jgi:hypothetical protein
MEDISKFDAEWILEDDPQVLTGEELDRYRKGLVPNDKEISNAMNGNVSLFLYIIHTCNSRFFPICSNFWRMELFR